MPQLTLTEVVGEPSSWQVKNGPAAGQTMHSYKVKAEDGTIYEINRKPSSGPPELGSGEYEVTPAKGDFPAKLKKVYKGGGGREGMTPERQRAIQRQHSQEMAVRLFSVAEPQHDGRTAKTYLPVIFALADEFDRDVNRVAGVDGGGVSTAGPPATSAPPPSASSSPAVSVGFTSQPQQDLFVRLLKNGGVNGEAAQAIVLYVDNALPPGDISDAIDALKGDEATVNAALGVLKSEAVEWRKKQGAYLPAPDTSDLPEVA